MRILGRTGLAVSEIALGTVELGLDYGIGADAHRPDFAECERILHRALDLGINFIDTARAYGESESIIGRVLASRRREFILCTKVLPAADPVESVEQSLRELRTGAVDIVMIHCRAHETRPDPDIANALRLLRAAGKLRFIGASVYGEEAALAAIADGFDCLQIAASALDRRMEEKALPEAARLGVGIVARSVLLKGVLSPRAASLGPALAPLRDAALRLGALDTLPELAYRYLLAVNPPHTLLVGASRAEEVEAAMHFAALGPLEPERMASVRTEPLLPARFLNPADWPAAG